MGPVIVGTAAIVAAGVGLSFGLLLTSGTKTGGDPGGAILAELLATSSAIPPGSQHSTYLAQEPEWIGSCSDATLRKGWGLVQGVTVFESSLPVAQVQSYVGTRLAIAGWKTARVGLPRIEGYVDGEESYTYLRRWTKVLPEKTLASISLQTSFPIGQQGSESTAEWLIGGTASPLPPVGFCGGG